MGALRRARNIRKTLARAKYANFSLGAERRDRDATLVFYVSAPNAGNLRLSGWHGGCSYRAVLQRRAAAGCCGSSFSFPYFFSGRRLHKLAPSETPTTENRRGWFLLGCFLGTALLFLLVPFFLQERGVPPFGSGAVSVLSAPHATRLRAISMKCAFAFESARSSFCSRR